MMRDRDFVHPWVEIEVWQPLFPQGVFGPPREKEIAHRARQR